MRCHEPIGREKKTDPRGLRGSAGSRKVPDSRNQKATTLVVAHDRSTSSSSRTSSSSSSLALVALLLLATPWRLYRHTHVSNVNTCDLSDIRRWWVGPRV